MKILYSLFLGLIVVLMLLSNKVLADNGVSEVVELRTRNSKTYDLGDDKYSIDSFIGAIHYDDNGNWAEIDNSFIPIDAPWAWGMDKAGYSVKVKDDFNEGQILEYSKNGYNLYLQPMNLEWTNDLDQIQLISIPQDVIAGVSNTEIPVIPERGFNISQGEIEWENAYGLGLDFSWRCSPTRLLKLLTVSGLNDLPPPASYILNGGNPVLRLSIIFSPPSNSDVDILVNGQVWDRRSKAETFDYIEFVDKSTSETLWGFAPLFYWDSNDNYNQSVSTLRKTGNSLYIEIRVPYTWLQDAIYPVYIDVDVDEQVGANTDDAGYDGTHTWATNTYLYVGSTDTAIGVRFQGVTIAVGATIDTAKISFRSVNTRGVNTIYEDIYGEDNGTPATYSTSGDFDARTTTTAKVDWTIDYWWSAGTWYDTPEIKTIVQELVDTYDYSGGRDMAYMIYDDSSDVGAYRVGYYHDLDAPSAAKLHIEYTAGPPDPPTNVSATDGVHTDKVVITWTKSVGATKYEVFRDLVGLGELGDVATYDDSGADAPTITAGITTATDGTFADRVELSLAGESANTGTVHSYTVKAGNGGWSGHSAADNGYRGVGALTYQWYRSHEDTDAVFNTIAGATTDPYDDVGGAVDPDGRYYYCTLTATGATSQDSTHDRGYKAAGAGTATPFILLGLAAGVGIWLIFDEERKRKKKAELDGE